MNYREFFATNNKSGWKCVESKLKNKEFQIYSSVNNFSTQKNLLELPFNEQVWLFIENKTMVPKCLECNGKVKYRNITLGYQKFCSLKCSNKNENKIKTTENNLLDKYGVRTSFKIPAVIDKTKETNLKKFGVDNHFKLKETQDKIKETNLDKYGFEVASKNNEVQDKIKQTNLKRYGYSSILKSPKVKDKIKQTNLNKYGVENALTSETHKEIFNEKRKATCLLKYGKELYIDSSVAKEILENNSEFSYIPNYKLTYNQKIITKEYLTKFIGNKGKDKLSNYVKMLLKFIRTFQPEFPTLPTYENLDYVLEYIKNFDTNKMHNKEDNSFNNRTSIVGCNYLKSTFKSFWNSSYKKAFGSPIDIWNNDKIMERIIAYRIGLNNSGEVFDFSLQNLIGGISAIRGTISFFKPVVAGAIYKHYLGDIENPRVFDPCSGFGGRMLGFKAIYPQGSYVGCEPNVNTYNELIGLGSNFSNVNVRNIKLEENVNDVDYDLCFTSIPYFDLENYKNGVEYRDFSHWKSEFIDVLLTYKRLVVNMPYDLCVKLKLENYIDSYLDNGRSHFNKGGNLKREVLIKMNF